MIRAGDEAILAGTAPDLLEGSHAAEAQAVAASYRHTVEQLEAAEDLRSNGDQHIPI